MSTTTPSRPAYQSKAGPLELATWANEQPDGHVSHVTYLTRNYLLSEDRRDGDDDSGWRKTHALRKHDLLVAAEMLRLAYVRISVIEALDRLTTEED